MTASRRVIGEVLLGVDDVSLAFGGVKALTGVSFDIRKGEIRAIIGPNGAGKSSMLNCINGFYHPQQGTIAYKGVKRQRMRPHEAAAQGIARTFQNIALFRGMSTLDNIMTGRLLKMRVNFLAQCVWYGPARNEEIRHREHVERIIDFLEIQAIRQGDSRNGCAHRARDRRGMSNCSLGGGGLRENIHRLPSDGRSDGRSGASDGDHGGRRPRRQGVGGHPRRHRGQGHDRRRGHPPRRICGRVHPRRLVTRWAPPKRFASLARLQTQGRSAMS